VVQCLPTKGEALSSNPSIAKKKKKDTKKIAKAKRARGVAQVVKHLE
jgi:hypothetical protein